MNIEERLAKLNKLLAEIKEKYNQEYDTLKKEGYSDKLEFLASVNDVVAKAIFNLEISAEKTNHIEKIKAAVRAFDEISTFLTILEETSQIAHPVYIEFVQVETNLERYILKLRAEKSKNDLVDSVAKKNNLQKRKS